MNHHLFKEICESLTPEQEEHLRQYATWLKGRTAEDVTDPPPPPPGNHPVDPPPHG